jgi:D-2-hydroxyacid dehydrogenase (NADP+)
MAEVLILLTLPSNVRSQYYDRIRERFPALVINIVDHVSKIEPHIATAEILITFGPMLEDRADEVLRSAKSLRWIQALGTGVDNIADRPSLRRDVILTNIHGIHGAAVSEGALLLMLALARGLPRVIRNQTQRVWERFPARLLDGKTVGIVGVGAIAAALAPRCQAMGMAVVGVTSTPRPVPGFDRMVRRDELVPAVREVDYLILLVPYSPETNNMVDGPVLAAMKPASYLINLARGGVVDEAALLTALRNRSIAGAALDVFATEPLPPDHPFWALDNVIVVPHLGGFNDEYPRQALVVVEENIRRFLAGDIGTMLNIVEH